MCSSISKGDDKFITTDYLQQCPLKQVRELQRLLGKKTMEVEILKEAVEYGQSRKWIAHAPLLPKDGE
jgi:hypothetical protein